MPLPLQLDYDRGIPVYRQIFEGVVGALSAGTLGRDEQLPTIHDLAARLSVNPGTVARAYRDLEHAGYIVGQRGRGTFPAPKAPKPLKPPTPAARSKVLRDIFRGAMNDAARHGISGRELIRYFKKSIDE